MISNANQNCGRQAVTFAIRVTTVSRGFPLFTALITPKRIPNGTLIINAAMEKNNVIGILAASTSDVFI